MKKILKQEISAVAITGDELGYPNIPQTIDYPHDSEILAEVAGHVLNRRLKYREVKDDMRMGVNILVQLCSRNPHNTSLYQMSYMSDLEIVQARYGTRLKQKHLMNMVEDLVEKAMEAVEIRHKLENSFWKRLKYLFKKAL